MMPIKNIEYYCGKIVEAVYDQGDSKTARLQGLGTLEMIEESVAELLAEVQASERDRWQELQFEFELIKHAISELLNFLQEPEPLLENRLTAKIFATYLYRALPDVTSKWENRQR